MLCTVADVHSLEHFSNTLLALRRTDIQIFKRKLDVFIYIKLVDEVEALEDEADVSFAELCAVLLLEFRHFLAQKLVASVCRVVKKTKNVKQC